MKGTLGDSFDWSPPPLSIMAGADSLPKSLPSTLEQGPTFKDEKGANESIDLASNFQGDVYDDGRAIDLGADGKERPIGRFPSLCPAQQGKPFIMTRQRLTPTLQHVWYLLKMIPHCQHLPFDYGFLVSVYHASGRFLAKYSWETGLFSLDAQFIFI